MSVHPHALALTAAVLAGACVALPIPPLLSGDPPTAALLATCGVLALLTAACGTLGWRLTRSAQCPEAAASTNLWRRTAHEVRGPLAVALGHLDLMGDTTTLPEEHRPHLVAGMRNIHRALALLPDPRASGDAPGAVSSTAQESDLSVMARAAVEDMAPLAARRQVAVSLDATGPTPVAGDPSRHRQVIDNLLSNAVKYAADAGWVDVLVTADDDGVRLQVTNAGTTLTPDEATHAFEVDFRAATAESSSVPGAGIGLSVVRELVQEHHGSVELVSDPEQGTTTVTVLLPAPTDATLISPG